MLAILSSKHRFGLGRAKWIGCVISSESYSVLGHGELLSFFIPYPPAMASQELPDILSAGIIGTHCSAWFMPS